MASKFFENPPTATLRSSGLVDDDEDNHDELLDTYSEILKEYIKFGEPSYLLF